MDFHLFAPSRPYEERANDSNASGDVLRIAGWYRVVLDAPLAVAVIPDALAAY
jgi:hypothetical protein